MKKLFYISLLFVLTALAAPKKQSLAVGVLNSIPSPLVQSSIITAHEWRELHLDTLIQTLNRTRTGCGPWGLETLLHPINDLSELMNRQDIITFLVEHNDVLTKLQKKLSAIKTVEADLFSYWDEQDLLSRDIMRFYYVIPVLKKYLNKNALALECSVGLEGLACTLSFFRSICLDGISTEITQFLLSPNQDFNLYQSVWNALERPLIMHSPRLSVLKNKISPQNGYSIRDYIITMLLGSLGDRYALAKEGWHWGAITKSFTKAPKPLAALTAALPVILYDIKWANDIYRIYKNALTMHTILTDLQHRTVHIATFFKHSMNLQKEVEENACAPLQALWENYAHINDAVAECIKDLQTERFSQERSYMYSRGCVLYMHVRIQRIKQLLIPLLQTIGLIDAYCSLAQLYNEHKGTNNPWCFVNYIDSKKPVINYTDAWLSILPLRHVVTNPIAIHGSIPNKIIITGPNGGGKSTYLKKVGQEAVLAQSWAMTPAEQGEQTLFAHIRTSLAPSENIYEGLSTFMAEKKRMEELRVIIKNSHEHNHVLALIDEPYRGTVDDESAKRIYNFGTDIAHNDNAVVYIATHVKKPIYLASETHGIFANYQIEIKDKGNGVFERTFKLTPGAAMWWFEDENKRSSFVDWIG